MKKTVIKLNYADAEPIARDCFLELSGLGANSKNHKELLAEGLQVLDSYKSHIDMAAVLLPLPPEAFRGNAVFMGKSQFSCTAFHQIPAGKVRGITAYLLSLGECKPVIESPVEQYYADLWANCFLEAGRRILREEIQRQETYNADNLYLSCSFGPGFYGMSPDRLSDMLAEVDGRVIGLSADSAGGEGASRETKFSGGFFFITEDEGVLPIEECRDCIGHEGGCLFCGGQNLIPSRETCMELLRSYGTPLHVVRHCIAVSKTAVRMAEALVEKGLDLDIPLVETSALLHDIARVEENHGVKGAILLERQGYHQVAKLIKCHMFYATDPYKDRITEQDLLCLADRMVREDEYVGLENRMQYVLNKLIEAGRDVERVRHRLDENRRLKERIEEIVGKSIDELME